MPGPTNPVDITTVPQLVTQATEALKQNTAAQNENTAAKEQNASAQDASNAVVQKSVANSSARTDAYVGLLVTLQGLRR